MRCTVGLRILTCVAACVASAADAFADPTIVGGRVVGGKGQPATGQAVDLVFTPGQGATVFDSAITALPDGAYVLHHENLPLTERVHVRLQGTRDAVPVLLAQSGKKRRGNAPVLHSEPPSKGATPETIADALAAACLGVELAVQLAELPREEAEDRVLSRMTQILGAGRSPAEARSVFTQAEAAWRQRARDWGVPDRLLAPDRMRPEFFEKRVDALGAVREASRVRGGALRWDPERFQRALELLEESAEAEAAAPGWLDLSAEDIAENSKAGLGRLGLKPRAVPSGEGRTLLADPKERLFGAYEALRRTAEANGDVNLATRILEKMRLRGLEGYARTLGEPGAR